MVELPPGREPVQPDSAPRDSAPRDSARVPEQRRPVPEQRPPSAAGQKLSGPARRAGAGVVCVLTLGVVGFALRGNPVAPPPSSSEIGLAARAFALGPADVANLSWGLTERTAAALQIATFGLWRGAVGAGGVLAQAREAMLVAAVITALLVWILGRRLGLTLAATTLAVVASSLIPWAVTAHRLIEPANLAVPWLLAAFLLSTPAVKRRLVAIPVALCVLVAVATAPISALVVCAGLAALIATGDLGSLRPATRTVLAGLFGLATVAGTVVAAGHALLAAAVPPPAPVPLDLLVAGTVVVAALAALRARWLIPFAAVLAPLAVVALAPGPGRTAALLLALPFGAVLIGAGADSVARRLTRSARPAWRFALGTGVAAAVASAALTLSFAAPLAYSATVDDGPAAARAWIDGNLDPDAVLIVDDAMWSELVRTGFPKDRLVSYTGLGRDETATTLKVQAAVAGAAGAPPVVLAGRPPATLGTDVSPLARTSYLQSLILADFGPADRPTEVRRVVRDVDSARVAAAVDNAVRRDAGTALAGNPRIELTGPARSALVNGEVDARLLSVLAVLASRHTVTVGAFPATPGERIDSETGTLRRRMLLAEIDGRLPAPGDPVAQLMLRWFDGQLPPFRPAEVTVDPVQHLMVVSYLAPSPTGLLPG